ncbi:flagellar filament capping protein FliD [Ureibacillus massiliensis]|uniref:flagellar filament capping protein FliD n=1 Tax=Ureibacillus massiliensis TaxID=292806 RepID=UPI000691CAEF|nr:flagellar filament capping protein FliD [Ureibacillus massiliensis]
MVTRIGGLASGMDIDSIVEKLMQAERAPLNKLQQNKTVYEWTRDAYRDINTKLKTFDTYLFDNFALSSNFTKKKSTITGINSDKLTITPASNASGTLNIQGVKQLATAATTGAVNVAQTSYRNAIGTDKLVDIGFTAQTINFKVDGIDKSITIDETTTVDSFISDLTSKGLDSSTYNSSTGQFSIGAKTAKVEVSDQASAEYLRELGFGTGYRAEALKVGENLAKKSTTFTELGITLPASFNYEINGEIKSIDLSSLSGTSTIDNLLTELNKSGSDITASFNETTGKFAIAGANGKTLQVSESSSSLLSQLGVYQSVSGQSVAFNEVADETPSTPTGSTILKHIGILDDGKFKLNTVQADGKMKETIIEFKATDTIDSLIKKINSSGAGVTALFSNGQMSITASNTGANKDGATSEIQLLTTFKKTVDGETTTEIDNSGQSLFNKLGFAIDATSTDTTFDLATTGGRNAEYMVNGLEMSSQTNTFNVSGYSIQLNGTFNYSGTSYDTSVPGVSVTSSNDTDGMMEKIKEFVTTYNGLITDLNSTIKEPKYRDYQPLTDEQKEDMSEDEIKLWEEKAKSGMLRNDSIIRDGMSSLRLNFSSSVGALNDKTIDALAEIGITTSKSYNDGGTLVIDETKLRAALEKDSEQVAKIFTQTGSKDATETDPATGLTKKVDTRGIVQRLRDSIDTFELNIEKKAGRSTMTDHQYSIGKRMLDIEERIERLQDRLVSVEERYWRQFTAMEQAINKANSQATLFAPAY